MTSKKPKEIKPVKMETFKITHLHRRKLKYYLDKFYRCYPNEKWTVLQFVKFFKERLKNNKDAWMGVSGETGAGKSLMAITCMILFGRPMNLNNNVTYLPSGEEIVDKFNKLSFNCLLIDEAAKDLRSINWQKKSQQSVTTKAQTDRFKNNWLFLNLPNFNEFTKSLRTTSIQFRAIVLYRTNKYARIVIHRKSRNWRDEDPWKDKIANDLYKKIEKNHELDNLTMIDIERRLPNTVMDFIIPNLELILPEITTEYERLKILSRTIEEDEGRTAPLFNMYKAKYENVMAIITKTLVYNELHIGKINVTKTEIAKKLGISTSTLRNYLDMDTRVFEKTRGIISEEEGKKDG